jgi:threonine dehydratase
VDENVRAIQELVDDVRLVGAEQMLNAIQHLWANEPVMAEPAGAATTAAWLVDDCSSALDGPTVLLVTGANISESVRRQL